ncbi:ribose-5-phosphate isomerase B [Geobacter sp. OR-1]|uniref:ribose 5-phosphate isomerase B n=1 Tax=Geobacter sp. OR-1 TaxID=1266765 RepID=UPI0005440C58|nr:ribose 5-phosphate isomerase B [Geobacter sp. OR-1]GAM09994.1 ribose-5-phosphate isomerase B [Geobacter sp. OR-1]
MKIALGSDHGGYQLKEEIVLFLKDRGIEVMDVGTDSDVSVDYPDFGEKVARLVAGGDVDSGIVVCGTGIGISIAANKIPGIRAALVTDSFMARMAKEHNNANVLALGGRVIDQSKACEIIAAWLDSTFEGGRHQARLDKIAQLEKSFCN